jgi:hypothetical protein
MFPQLLEALATHRPPRLGLRECACLVEEYFARAYYRLMGWVRGRKAL